MMYRTINFDIGFNLEVPMPIDNNLTKIIDRFSTNENTKLFSFICVENQLSNLVKDVFESFYSQCSNVSVLANIEYFVFDRLVQLQHYNDFNVTEINNDNVCRLGFFFYTGKISKKNLELLKNTGVELWGDVLKESK